jgi:hypothetical protein
VLHFTFETAVTFFWRSKRKLLAAGNPGQQTSAKKRKGRDKTGLNPIA